MEIVGGDGSKTQLKPGQARELGRADGLDFEDKTISRRQISFFISPFSQDQVQFEVLGRNPIYVHKKNEVTVYRRFERGEMGNGDMFCVSAKNPVWYSLKGVGVNTESVRRNDSETELAVDLESGSGFDDIEEMHQESVDMSNIDPVKEFGFLVMGHEFDSYPKKRVLDIKNWDWFLEESMKDSEEDEDEGKRRQRRKRKKGTENDDDDEWTGESEDDKVLINKSKKDQNPKYATRSKDPHVGTSKDRRKSGKMGGKKNREVEDEDEDRRKSGKMGGKKNREVEDEDEDEDEDETLGGFIVDDENLEEENEIEEEEFEDEDEDEEDE